MKKHKLSLTDLNVHSFVTNVNGKEEIVAGGLSSSRSVICSRENSCPGLCTMEVSCHPHSDCPFNVEIIE